MQLLSFRTEDHTSFGALIEGRIVDLGRHLPEYDSLRHLLEGHGIVRALDTAAEVSPDFRLDKVKLLTPITDAEHVHCIFDDARDEPIPIDPKFIRGHGQTLRLPEGDSRPVAAGVATALAVTEDGPEVLGYSLMSYLSPASLSAGPWLTTPEALPEKLDLVLTVRYDEQSAELLLPDPTATALNLAREKPMSTGDLIAVLHYLPDLSVAPGSAIEIDSPVLGTLRNPVKVQPA